MRMDNSTGEKASDCVNQLPEWELRNIFRTYGEEKFAKPIASAIVKERQHNPIMTTMQLVKIIADARPYNRKEKIHPATKVFQALRIFVNDELEALAKGLESSQRVLKENGREVIISFHSLEDRIVKRFFNERSGRGGAGVSRFMPLVSKPEPTFQLLTKSPIRPSVEELEQNSRARSAKMRAATRVARQ
jgi:16S rRNA (cytosine1402-N4)-methyltransferase